MRAANASPKNGTGTLTFTGTNNYSGFTAVNLGGLKSTQATGTPFGTGATTVTNSALSIAPAGSGTDVALTGGTLAAGTNFTYNAGATLSLDKGSQTQPDVHVWFGHGGHGVRSRNQRHADPQRHEHRRAGRGERRRTVYHQLVGSTAPTLVNTLVNGVIAQDRSANNAGDFVTYGATNGFTKATYTLSNTFTGSTNTSVVSITSPTTSAATTAVYALKVTGTTVTNTGNTITLGGSTTGVDGLILNGGTISGGTITTPNSTEGLIYVGSAGGTITSVLNSGTSSGGLTVFGPGALDVSGSAGNGFTAGLRVNQSTIIYNNDAQLGGTQSAIAIIGGTLQSSGTVALGTTGQRNITLSPGGTSLGATFNVTSGTTTFTSATSKVLTGTGALIKTGSGTLALAGTVGNTYTGVTNVNAGTLLLSTGTINSSPTVSVSSVGTLTLQNAAALSDTGTLTLVSGATLNLNAGSGTSETITTLILDGTVEPMGTYTATQLTALDAGITFSSLNGETLTVVPEPGTYFAGALLVGAVGWSLRRRFAAGKSMAAI